MHLLLSSNGFSVSSPPDSACGLVCRVGDRKAALALANVQEYYILMPAVGKQNATFSPISQDMGRAL